MVWYSDGDSPLAAENHRRHAPGLRDQRDPTPAGGAQSWSARGIVQSTHPVGGEARRRHAPLAPASPHELFQPQGRLGGSGAAVPLASVGTHWSLGTARISKILWLDVVAVVVVACPPPVYGKSFLGRSDLAQDELMARSHHCSPLCSSAPYPKAALHHWEPRPGTQYGQWGMLLEVQGPAEWAVQATGQDSLLGS